MLYHKSKINLIRKKYDLSKTNTRKKLGLTSSTYNRIMKQRNYVATKLNKIIKHKLEERIRELLEED